MSGVIRPHAPVAQWIESLTSNQKVVGSSPAGRAKKRPKGFRKPLGLRDAHIALYDIDGDAAARVEDDARRLNRNINEGRATITAHLGVENRREALEGADYVVNAIQVGGYEPAP